MDMMYLQLEGATIEELRAQAILALDLRIQTATQGEAKVAELKIEPINAGEISDSDTQNVAKMNAAMPDTQPEPAAEPKKRGPRKAKTEPSITEVAGTIEAEPRKLDLESVKEAFSQYSQKFGVAAAQEDGPKLLGRIFGEGVVNRIRDVPVDDQLKLGRVIAAVEGALMTNEFKRAVVQ